MFHREDYIQRAHTHTHTQELSSGLEWRERDCLPGRAEASEKEQAGCSGRLGAACAESPYGTAQIIKIFLSNDRNSPPLRTAGTR